MDNNLILYVDPDGQPPIIPILWAAYELGSAIYDGCQALTTEIDIREMFMKGIDYSYYYEEN